MRKLRQKKEPFRVILNDLMSWRPDWVAGDPVSTNKQTQQHQQRPSLRSSVGWLPQETAMLLCMQTDSIYQGLLCCVDLPRMKQGMKLQPCTRGQLRKEVGGKLGLAVVTLLGVRGMAGIWTETTWPRTWFWTALPCGLQERASGVTLILDRISLLCQNEEEW